MFDLSHIFLFSIKKIVHRKSKVYRYDAKFYIQCYFIDDKMTNHALKLFFINFQITSRQILFFSDKNAILLVSIFLYSLLYLISFQVMQDQSSKKIWRLTFSTYSETLKFVSNFDRLWKKK